LFIRTNHILPFAKSLFSDKITRDYDGQPRSDDELTLNFAIAGTAPKSANSVLLERGNFNGTRYSTQDSFLTIWQWHNSLLCAHGAWY